MGGEEDGNSSRMHERLLLVGSEDKSNLAEDYRVMDTQEAQAGSTQVGLSSQPGLPPTLHPWKLHVADPT